MNYIKLLLFFILYSLCTITAQAVIWHADQDINGFDLYSGNELLITSTTVGHFGSGTTIDSNIAWHKGNDGSGSLLDADLLDGVDSLSYATRSWVINNFVTSTTGATQWGAIGGTLSNQTDLITYGNTKQPLHANLTAWSVPISAANKLEYWSASNTAALTDFTAFARSLLDDTSSVTMRATLGADISLASSLDTGLLNASGQTLSLDTQAVNKVFAGPSSGSDAVPGFRSVVDADIPDNITITNLSGTNTGNVSLAGTPDYITLSGQVITRALINLATHVTGTLADGSLSSNIPLKNAANTFAETNTFSKGIIVGTGTVSSKKSIALNGGTASTGDGAIASGTSAVASGVNSIAMGVSSTASGIGSVALGGLNTATGFYSISLGYSNTNSGDNSIALGGGNTISNNSVVAIGNNNTASAVGSTAIGNASTASADYAVAIGYQNNASGLYSSAMGLVNIASGYGSHSYSDNSTVKNLTGFWLGGGHNSVDTSNGGVAGDTAADAGGIGGYQNWIKNTGQKSIVLGGDRNQMGGAYSLVQGYENINNGDYSVALGYHIRLSTLADNTFVFGNGDSTTITAPNIAAFFPNGTTGKVGINRVPTSGISLDVAGVANVSGGTGTGRVTVGGNLVVNTTSVGTGADTSEDTLIQYTLPANTLAAGHYLIVHCGGTMSGNSTHTKRLKLKLGSTALIDTGVLTIGPQDWELTSKIICTGSSAEICSTDLKYFTLATSLNDYTEPTIDITANAIISMTGTNGQAIANDILQKYMIVEYY